MDNIIEYKGYHAKLRYIEEDGVIRGHIEGISDYIDFECTSIKNISREFKKAVEDYISFCAQVGKSPEREYKGQFNVRISPELHKRLALRALQSGETINSCVSEALEAYCLAK